MNKKKALKIFVIILLILLILFIIHTARNFIIINSLQKNISQYTSKTNLIIKSKTTENESTLVNMTYYKKDDKQKMIMDRIKDGKTTTMTMYNNGERIDTFFDTPEGKIAQINSNSMMSVTLVNSFDTDSNWQRLVMSAIAIIRNVDYNGKEVYAITNFVSPYTLATENGEITYIDKDTGLLMKYISGDLESEKEYEFDTVTDDVFIEPDIGQYKIQDNNE